MTTDPSAKTPRTSLLTRLRHEPLMLFLLLGLAVFLAERMVGGRGGEDATIVVDARQIDRLHKLWFTQTRRPPTDFELDALVQDHVREEVLYREALRLGLDRDDTIIRRRLAQKMGFLMDDTARIDEPGDDALEAFYEANRQRYLEPRRTTFRHVYVKRDRADSGRLAEELLRRLTSEPEVNWRALGDPFMLQREYAERSDAELAELFGGAFTEQLARRRAGLLARSRDLGLRPASGGGHRAEACQGPGLRGCPGPRPRRLSDRRATPDEHRRLRRDPGTLRGDSRSSRARRTGRRDAGDRPVAVRSRQIACRRPAPLLAILAVLLLATASSAHEVRPAYLELAEGQGGLVHIVFKQPLNAGRLLPLEPLLTPACQPGDPHEFEDTGTALIERWTISCSQAEAQDPSTLVGRRLTVEGLDRTLTDTLLTVRLVDGTEMSTLMRPDGGAFTIDRDAEVGAPAYLELGVEHLLFGFDHILFVVAMVFYVRRPWEIFKVITAFTVAHSITLALSSLGLVRLRQAPVEVVIALSILFLAVELAKPAAERSPITSENPWLVAFSFGLLHGFGFAGALAEIGLPQNAAALALFLFNVGVEVGQLLIVAIMIVAIAVSNRLPVRIPPRVGQLPIWGLGTLSAYWFLERLFGMVAA